MKTVAVRTRRCSGDCIGGRDVTRPVRVAGGRFLEMRAVYNIGGHSSNAADDGILDDDRRRLNALRLHANTERLRRGRGQWTACLRAPRQTNALAVARITPNAVTAIIYAYM